MPIPLSPEQVLDRYSLEMRCKVLDVAAALDRLDRAEGKSPPRDDARLRNLRKAVGVLLDDQPDRAQHVQMIFSDAYQTSWERPLGKS